jgi:predicted methyltransferase
VTCWLLDVAKAKPEALTRLRAMGLRTPDEHRLAVQTLVYRLADRVLRPGGVLQVVDRMSEPLGEALAAGILRVQRAQSKGTSLEFLSLDAHPVDAGALVSVRSRKAQ